MHLVSAEIKEQAILWQASTIDGFSKAGCCLLKHQHQRGGEVAHLKAGTNESLWFSAAHLIGAMSNTAGFI